jgi:hypothetical protein
MIFVVLLPLADSPIGDRFGFQQKFLFIRVHLCASVVKTAFNCIVPAGREDLNYLFNPESRSRNTEK